MNNNQNTNAIIFIIIILVLICISLIWKQNQINSHTQALQILIEHIEAIEVQPQLNEYGEIINPTQEQIDAFNTQYTTIRLLPCLHHQCLDAQIYLHQQGGTQYQDVLFCESSLNPLAESELSTAKGIAQFLDGTWKAYCQGNPLSYKDNIDCFLTIYPNNPDWWECDINGNVKSN